MKMPWFAVMALAAVATAQPPAPNPGWKLSGPFTHQNLAVYLIHGREVHPGKKFLTLQEALAARLAVVHETGKVSELAVENLSADAEVFIQAGDLVKGGRQDRVLAYDLIVPVTSGRMALPSFCVEANRWQGRGGEDAGRFSASSGQLPGKALRLAVSSARQQAQVWDQVKDQQARLSRRLNRDVADPASPSSLQLTLEDKALQAQIQAFAARLEPCIGGKPDVVGAVVAINGKVEGADVYGAAALFRPMWPKVLRAWAVDAVAEYQPGRRYELAEPDEVAAFLAAADHGMPAETEVNRRVRVARRENETAVVVESRDQGHQGALLHRNYIAR
jgi:hypothetical protein